MLIEVGAGPPFRSGIKRIPRLPHPYRMLFAIGWGLSSLRIVCFPNHALGVEAVSAVALPALHYLQLLPPPVVLRYGTSPRAFRDRAREGSHVVRDLHCGLRRHARARAFAGERTRAQPALGRRSDAEADGSAQAAAAGRAAVLASALL